MLDEILVTLKSVAKVPLILLWKDFIHHDIVFLAVLMRYQKK